MNSWRRQWHKRMLARLAWLKMTKLVPKGCQFNAQWTLMRGPQTYFPRHKCNLTKSKMMSSTWIRWCSIPKWLQSGTSSLKKTSDLSRSGSRNRRSSILWWRLKDLRISRSKMSVSKGANWLWSKGNKSSLTKSRRGRLLVCNTKRSWRKKRFKWN